MNRPRMRPAEPLGILLGLDDGLLQCLPGEEPVRAITAGPITSVDARGGIAAAAGPGAGAWLHTGARWRQVWEGDARCVLIGANDPRTPHAPRSIYLGTAAALLRSTDNGETWTAVRGTADLRHDGAALPPRRPPPPIVAVAEGRSGLVVGFDGGGAWFTADGGETWFHRSEGLDAAVHHLYSHPDVAGRLYATTASGLYRSTDEGLVWVRALSDLDRSWGGDLAVLPGPSDTLLLALGRSAPGRGGALFRSVNAGLSWSRILLDGEDEWERVPALVRPTELEDVTFVAAGSRVFASHDRGRSWTALLEGLPPAHAIAASL